ncbi:MAG: L,D-transpeptidase [Crocinitomicaceae bacterium]|nr:L,D-transpeptidase [Crocinitomicaceae bacterium]
MKYLFASLALTLCIGSACSQDGAKKDSLAVDGPTDSNQVVYTKSLQTIMKEKGIAKGGIQIIIDKTAYTLEVYHEDSLLMSYPCVFGFNETDDKRQEGDGCTPEGKFGIRSQYPHKSWKYFIWVDYPTKESWSKFKKSKADGDIPSSATVGGEIGIHGVPEGYDNMIDDKTNWTLGCISLKNKDIEDLYKSVNSKTKILIVH